MNQPTITIKQLYPELSLSELKVAEQNLEQYLVVVIRIHRRISSDSKALAALRADLHPGQPIDQPPGQPYG